MSDPTPESLLDDLRAELGEVGERASDKQLLPFLYWKPDVERAAKRYRDMLEWKRSEVGIFDETLRLTKDPELERLVASEVIITPPGLTTKAGGPLVIGRFRNNDMTDGRTIDGVVRMLYYTIDQLVQRPETQKHGVTIVHDLRGFNKSKNVRLEITKRLFQGFIGVFPVQIKGVYICQAPLVFIGFFKLVSVFMPSKLKSRIHFIDSFEELETVHKIADPSHLLPEMGGTLEWNVKDWIDEQKRKEESGDFTSLTTMGL